jgi:hypothetical protein
MVTVWEWLTWGSDEWKEYHQGPGSKGQEHTPESVAAAKKFLVAELALLSLAAAPAVYALSLRKKKKLKAGEERLGVAMENASSALGTLTVTALAAPAVAAGITYITVQKLEDAEYITKGLGDGIQTLMAVAAAGPAIAGIGQIATSAFKKGK